MNRYSIPINILFFRRNNVFWVQQKILLITYRPPKQFLVRVPGLEPGTSVLSGLRSNHLSYTRILEHKVYTLNAKYATKIDTVIKTPYGTLRNQLWLGKEEIMYYLPIPGSSVSLLVRDIPELISIVWYLFGEISDDIPQIAYIPPNELQLVGRREYLPALRQIVEKGDQERYPRFRAYQRQRGENHDE